MGRSWKILKVPFWSKARIFIELSHYVINIFFFFFFFFVYSKCKKCVSKSIFVISADVSLHQKRKNFNKTCFTFTPTPGLHWLCSASLLCCIDTKNWTFINQLERLHPLRHVCVLTSVPSQCNACFTQQSFYQSIQFWSKNPEKQEMGLDYQNKNFQLTFKIKFHF